ncbi:MAG: hypothetical protein JSV86_01965 [Gemmatimonadota bacterium]|nr:MAG: hypothetical protein JSV86_01965 [Gemmatimonadota bacterium]
MDDSLRGPLIVLEVIALGVVLALVDDTLARVALGLLIALLLARGAITAGRVTEGDGPPAGLSDRRQDHLFRHWVNVLLKKIREFHTVCQGVSSGGVNLAVGQLRIHEIEREIQDLMAQVTESAKPSEMKRGWRRKPAAAEPKEKPET